MLCPKCGKQLRKVVKSINTNEVLYKCECGYKDWIPELPPDTSQNAQNG